MAWRSELPRPGKPHCCPGDGGILGAHGCRCASASARGLAFCMLPKLKTACRTSDLCGLNPSSLRLNRLGLDGVLEKTKTTGAGKRIRHLPIYICHSALICSVWAGRFGLILRCLLAETISSQCPSLAGLGPANGWRSMLTLLA